MPELFRQRLTGEGRALSLFCLIQSGKCPGQRVARRDRDLEGCTSRFEGEERCTDDGTVAHEHYPVERAPPDELLFDRGEERKVSGSANPAPEHDENRQVVQIEPRDGGPGERHDLFGLSVEDRRRNRVALVGCIEQCRREEREARPAIRP